MKIYFDIAVLVNSRFKITSFRAYLSTNLKALLTKTYPIIISLVLQLQLFIMQVNFFKCKHATSPFDEIYATKLFQDLSFSLCLGLSYYA